jgi:HK97 family phage major capsid protein
MAKTFAQLISEADERKRAAERRATDAKADLKRYLEALDSAGVKDHELTAEQRATFDTLNKAHRAAIDDVKHADGALRALREAKAEDDRDAEDARTRDTSRHVDKPGQSGSFRPNEVQGSHAPGGVRVDNGHRWIRTTDGRPADLAPGQRWSDHPLVQEFTSREAERDRYIVGQHGSLGQYINSLPRDGVYDERALTTSGASAVVPLGWANEVIDKVRARSAIFQAGPTILPMAHKVEYYGRLTADVTNVAFRAEGDTTTSGDPTFDQVTLTARTISGLCVMSVEWFEDSINGEQLVQDSLAQALSQKIDAVALYGGLTTGTNNEGQNYPKEPNPDGLLHMLEDQAAANILGAAANGTPITAATPFNEILDTVYQPQLNNHTPNALLWNVKMKKKLAKTYTTTYEQLPMPAELRDLNVITSNEIVSYTQGTMTGTATDIFVGDFSEFLVGMRAGISLQLLDQRYAETGQVAVLAMARLDFALAQPLAFAMYRALGGS